MEKAAHIMSLLSSWRIMLSVTASKSSLPPIASNSAVIFLISSSDSASVDCAASEPGSAPAAATPSLPPTSSPRRLSIDSVCATALAPAAPLCCASAEKTLAATWPSACGSAASAPPAVEAPAPVAISCSVSSTVR
jgi:hypothetical protein